MLGQIHLHAGKHHHVPGQIITFRASTNNLPLSDANELTFYQTYIITINLSFYLALCLTFVLACTLTFYRTVHLIYVLIYFDILSDTLSGILSKVDFDIYSDTLFGMYFNILSLSDILSDMISDSLPDIYHIL